MFVIFLIAATKHMTKVTAGRRNVFWLSERRTHLGREAGRQECDWTHCSQKARRTNDGSVQSRTTALNGEALTQCGSTHSS